MRALAAGFVALLLLVVGCSVDGDRSSAPRGVGGGAPDDIDRLAFGGLDGGELRFAMARPASFRPDEAVLSDQAAVVIADLLYDGLTEVDGAGAVLGPGLARSWEAADDYRRWTFRLDPARGVTADAVVRALGPLEVSVGRRLPSSRPAAALTAGMVAVSAVDVETVQIELERSNAGLPWIVSGLPFSIVGVDGAPTGDYEIVGDDRGSLRLRRRPERGGSVGPFPSIEVVWVDEGPAAYQLLVDGAVDAAIVGPASLAAAERRFGVAASAAAAVRFYVLNPGSPELADRDQRAALLALVDADALVGGAGRGDLVAIDGLVSPSMAGYRPDTCGVACGELDDGRGGVDTEAASSWPADVSLRVTYAGDGQGAMAKALAGQLDAAGVPASSTEATAHDLATAIVDGSPDLFAFGWVAPAGTVDAVLPPLLRGESPANVARFASPGIEKLLDEAATTGDDEARWSLLDRAHRSALAEAKVLPAAASTGTLVVAPEVSGVAIRADGSLDLEWFD